MEFFSRFDGEKRKKKVIRFFLHPFSKDQIILAVPSSLLLLSEVLHLSLPLSPSLLYNFQPVHQNFIYVTSAILHVSIFENQDLSLVIHPVILYLVPPSLPHLLYSCMQVIHLHNLSLALQLPVLHHSNSLSWGSIPGQVELSTSKKQRSHFPSWSIIPHSKQPVRESCWLHRGQVRLKGQHTCTTGRNLSCRPMTSKRADAQSLCPLPCNRSHFPENNPFPVYIPAGKVLSNKYLWNIELPKTFFMLATLNWMLTRNTKYTLIMQCHFYMAENLSSSLVFPS